MIIFENYRFSQPRWIFLKYGNTIYVLPIYKTLEKKENSCSRDWFVNYVPCVSFISISYNNPVKLMAALSTLSSTNQCSEARVNPGYNQFLKRN